MRIFNSEKYKKLYTTGFLAVIMVLFFVVFSRFPTQFSDWHYFFRPAVQTWLHGNSPYQISGFVNPPWLIFLLLPFAYLPEQYGLASFALFSIVIVILSIRLYQGNRILVIGGLLTPSLFSLLLLGQIDALVLLGILIGDWAVKNKKWCGLGFALACVLIKPQIGAGVALLWLWKTPIRLKTPALAMLSIIWVTSSIVIGSWWPLNIWNASIIRSSLMDVSLFTAIKGLDLPLLFYIIFVVLFGSFWVVTLSKNTINRYTTALSILTTALISPYIARHSMTVVMGTAFIWIGQQSWRWGIILYLLTWILLLGIWIKPWFGGWEIVVWLGMWAGMVMLRKEE